MIQYPGFDKIAFAIGPFDRTSRSAQGPLVRNHVRRRLRRGLVAGAACARSSPGSTWKPADVDDFMFFGVLGVILGGRLG